MRAYHRDLVRELTRFGINPHMEQTNGNHVRIEWEIGGKAQSILTANSPSDHRAILNARARIRRQLRAAGVYHHQQRHARPSETEDAYTLAERVEQLELDVITLLDMIQQGPLHPAPPEPPLNPLLPPAQKRNQKRSTLLFYVPFDHWVSLKEIIKSSGRNANKVSVALNALKKRGDVAHDKVAHKWRKTLEGVSR